MESFERYFIISVWTASLSSTNTWGSILKLFNLIKFSLSDSFKCSIKIIENLSEENKNDILRSLPPKDRFVLLESLSYPEDSAARIMQREFTAIPSNWSVGQTIDYLRENKDLPEEFLEIFVVDNEFQPIGTVPSSKMLMQPFVQLLHQKYL